VGRLNSAKTGVRWKEKCRKNEKKRERERKIKRKRKKKETVNEVKKIKRERK
jgi:hypothetical protein